MHIIHKAQKRRIKSLCDNKIDNPVEIVPVVLYSDVVFDENGTAKYGFFTRRALKDGVEIPAKSPDGMFSDEFIPNDLGLVVDAMTEYYS